MTNACFLTGTDTGIGKTFAACAMLHAWRDRGFTAAGYKPVAAGAEELAGHWSNDDARRLHAASWPQPGIDEINPVCLRSPIAPHIAACEEGVELELAPLLAGFHHLARRYDRLVVEGVGGFLVPLGKHFGSAELALALELPVVLVVGLRLGCLNHATLTAEAIRVRGLRLAGWIGNRITTTPMSREAENIANLRNLLAAPCLGLLPHQTDDSAKLAAASLNLTAL